MLTIALLYGGASSEHSVSCITALGVSSAIDRTKYRVVPIGITETGKFVHQELNPKWKLADLPKVSSSAPAVEFTLGSSSITIQGESIQLDLVFPVLHGPYGEDGQVQRELVGLINEHGPYAVGMSGEDAHLFTAERRDAMVDGVATDIGQVGDIESIDPSVIDTLEAGGFIPVVAPISAPNRMMPIAIPPFTPPAKWPITSSKSSASLDFSSMIPIKIKSGIASH